MKNRFFESNLKPKSQSKKSILDKNKYSVFIENTNSDIMIAHKMSKIKRDIKNNNSYNNIKRPFKKNQNDIINNNTLRNNNLKTRMNINTNILDDKHFIREIGYLFEETTNNNIADYFNGRDVEKMDDFVKRIKVYNYNNFMKSLKKKKSKNSKMYNNYKQRNYAEIPYNLKSSLYSLTTCGNEYNKNKIYNNSEYTRTLTSNTYRNYMDDNNKKFGNILNNFGYELNNYTAFNSARGKINCICDLIGNNNERINKKKIKVKNDIKTLIDGNNKRRTYSYNSKINKKKVYNLII